LEIGIEGEVPFIKTGCFERRGLRAVDRKVEDGRIQELDLPCVVRHEIEGMLRLTARLRRRAEEEIDVGRDRYRPFLTSPIPARQL